MKIFTVALLFVVNAGAAAMSEAYEVSASTDLRVLFATDDAEELRLAAASLWQGNVAVPAVPFDAIVDVSLLKCARALIEERRGGMEGTRVAAEILAGLTYTQHRQHDAAQLLQRCRQYRRDTARERLDRNEQARYIAHLSDYGDHVRTMLYRFIKPTTTCYQLSGYLGVGLLAAFGGDVALEYCAANNGRHWVQTALEGQLGYGVGALTLWRLGNYRYRMNYLGGPFTYTKSRSKKWALGFGVVSHEYGEEYAHRSRGIIIVIPSRRNDRASAGLGVAYLRTWGQRAGLKFIPLGTRDKRLLSEFAALSRRDLLLEEATLSGVLHMQENARLQIEAVDNAAVKFRLCTNDTSVCEYLLGGRAFPLSVIVANLQRLQTMQGALRKEHDRLRIKMLGAAILATASAAPSVLKNAAGNFSRHARILPSRWDGFDYNEHLGRPRGLRSAKTPARQQLWQPLQELLQKVFDSRPLQAVGETSSSIVEAWNALFVKMGRERMVSRALRVGIPGVVIVGSGIVVMLTSLKLAEFDLALQKTDEIKTQQEEIAKLLENPYHEVIITDRRLLLQSLHYLVGSN